MFDRINEDIKNAMKAKEKEKLEVLRYLKAMLIENKTSKSPKNELDIVIGHSKKLKDSIQAYPEGSEQREKIAKEVEFLTPYLPEQMGEEQVQKIIEDIGSKLDNPNMGAIMKDLSPQIKGKFDGKKASQMVMAFLKK
ncbi:MAG: GatB/YqeY domain-containing protein [Bacteriovoracaceae bacterium]